MRENKYERIRARVCECGPNRVLLILHAGFFVKCIFICVRRTFARVELFSVCVCVCGLPVGSANRKTRATHRKKRIKCEMFNSRFTAALLSPTQNSHSTIRYITYSVLYNARIILPWASVYDFIRTFAYNALSLYFIHIQVSTGG